MLFDSLPLLLTPGLCYYDCYGCVQDGTTALMRASFCGSAAAVEVLLDAGAEMNIQDDNVSH